MAVNEKITDSKREEKVGFEMVDEILDKLNEVVGVTTDFSSSVSGETLSKIGFNLVKDSKTGAYSIQISVNVTDSKGATSSKKVTLGLK